ncbi:MAG: hypothetical protein HYS13_24725 [Planctomycetia bacterium]|nr:hypothetical protein [Planctomycetia bacterium]
MRRAEDFAAEFAHSVAQVAGDKRWNWDSVSVPSMQLPPRSEGYLRQAGAELANIARTVVSGGRPDVQTLIANLEKSAGAGDEALLCELCENQRALVLGAVKSLRGYLQDMWHFSEATVDAMIGLIGQSMLVELSKPAFLKSAEEEAGRSGKSVQDVLNEDVERYEQGLRRVMQSRNEELSGPASAVPG